MYPKNPVEPQTWVRVIIPFARFAKEDTLFVFAVNRTLGSPDAILNVTAADGSTGIIPENNVIPMEKNEL